MKIIKNLLLLILLIPCSLIAEQKIVNGIPINILKGSNYEMGVEYGQQMRQQMSESLKIIENYYIKQKGLTYNDLFKQANELYKRFPDKYKSILKGAAKGANISLNDEIILNGMETLVVIKAAKPKLNSGCAFASISQKSSYSNSRIILRNYDYSKPFNKISKLLSITTFNFSTGYPVAIIAMPGQLYCPSCLNSKGVFIELNNGFLSGGSSVNANKETMLIQMLSMLRTSKDIAQLNNKLEATQSDFSLIINAGDSNNTISYEYSSTKGHKKDNIQPNSNFVVTNNFLSPKWGDLVPKPNIKTMGSSITRRSNLTKLIESYQTIDIPTAKKIMDTNVRNGGAKNPYTIYQIIYDTKAKNIYLNLEDNKGWREIPFKDIF
ncbi:C45 family autoproteolytic acyltransferase/hydolase [Francisella sp. 19X1-34]|uniref:C45 family autoproteolytic acyltransferase/hydolase n=1 Tax=Francisella sp. 19X1-34 TaxID=3087177 RepID=UPI002E339819|nr:C45 family autoproteolytic acyltransferase/hydolase [Francisella sp. 19X1-34]MED7787949.1 C45 family autoproteolytic acyltransferase/hydrolase [Francisella sp. 19X1-34]